MVESNLLMHAIIPTIMYYMRLQAVLYRDVAYKQFKAEAKETPRADNFDFIIVGGGTAGCLLAGKLSQHFEVLLLEAGGPPPSFLSVPGFRKYAISRKNKEFNWVYYTTRQKQLSNRIIPITAGRMLGGSYSHNSLIFNRGNRRDYDNWAKITNDPSWKYENVLQIFKDLENYRGPFPSDQRGSHGPISVETQNTPILDYYKSAAAALGYSYSDPNGPQMEALSPLDFTKRKARASTTYSEFIEPFIGIRKTLTVIPYAEVTKILFKNKSAIGVSYTRFGKVFQAFADKEVVISAGTFGSPLLLFKSGIGPKDMLEEAGIISRIDLPVGIRIEEHIGVPYQFTTMGKFQLTASEADLLQGSIESFKTFGQEDFLSEVDVVSALFFTSSVAKSAREDGWPDMQLITVVKTIYEGSKHDAWAILNRPASFGSFKLNSTAYKQGERRNTRLAVIELNYLNSEEDLKRMLEGINLSLKLHSQEAFQNIGLRILPNTKCANKAVINSTDYWKCVVRKYSTTFHHAVGTCRMGYGPTDPAATIDHKFRVIGIRKLRVIDGSIMPRIINTNTNAATLLIAEKGFRSLIREHS